ncbi:hypothetical protein BD324DRAFT_652945 [Kockovaella imperatae]|uniref:BTB domain-containing protein n=1 Tax=Kockovaella imperatae TaxID=4999 RepID=A0A1Y1U9H1_9TREE|nr:hypothetical protein BD324DRAFT_652945 [Kockovaella imperatae]ORX34680.1 hypothetical protein BD324DRAFT_652945 [Kockovaella imperatae]
MTESSNSPSQTTSNGTTASKVCYTDPSADVTLVSTPEGRHFKVQSFWLKANSAYFRKVLSSPEYHGDAIQVPAPTKVLKIYLDLCHVRHLPPKLLWSVREPLFKLCDEYQSPSIAERALFHSSECMDKDPWQVFCLASQRRNVGLAKSALRAMDDSMTHVNVTSITPELASGVTMPFLLGLYNAALEGRVGQSNGYANGHGHGYDHDHNHGQDRDVTVTWKALPSSSGDDIVWRG